MTVCQRCNRPLKRPTDTGLGPVCARRAPPPAIEPDLFGVDAERALESVRSLVEFRADEAHRAVKVEFQKARERMEAIYLLDSFFWLGGGKSIGVSSHARQFVMVKKS